MPAYSLPDTKRITDRAMPQRQYPNAAGGPTSKTTPSSSRITTPIGHSKQNSRNGTLSTFTNATKNMLRRDRRSRDSLSQYRGAEQAEDGFDNASQASTDLSVTLDDNPEPHAPPPNMTTGDRTTQSREGRAADAGGPKNVAFRSDPSLPSSPDPLEERSLAESSATYETQATSVHTLPALQAKATAAELDDLEPIQEDDPASYNLLAPADPLVNQSFDLEQRGEDMFGRKHLETIFKNPTLLLKFTSFLGEHKPKSVPTLIYYLDALKALRAIRYANAVAEALDPLDGHEFTSQPPASTHNTDLREKASKAFDLLVQEDLPAYITHTFISIVSMSLERRITGTMPPHLREASEGLAEVFCMSDPSRPDNPLVFASEEFHRTTQYGMNYALGRNCRFLQGPASDRNSVRRLKEAIEEGKDHCETFVNYRRDGSPFLNLLMMAPLRDSRGVLRYFIGAQIDVTGLAKECTELVGLQRLLAERAQRPQRTTSKAGSSAVTSNGNGRPSTHASRSVDATTPIGISHNDQETDQEDEFQQLSEMFNLAELDIVKQHGGRMHREHADDDADSKSSWHRPRLLLKDPSPNEPSDQQYKELGYRVHGKLKGVYQHYLLVRPYPSLRILFTSPSLRVPGILQSHFMNRIGSSDRVREELLAALAEGRGVTAKVRWVSARTQGDDAEGRNRWIHCTPLLGANGNIGVWMIVLVDDESSRPSRRFRAAPPVAADIPRKPGDDRDRVQPSSSNVQRSGAPPTSSIPRHRSHTSLRDV